MVSQYSSNRHNESRLSRTVLRLAILFGIAFALFQAYPYLRSYWNGWMPGASTETALEEVQRKLDGGDREGAVALLDAQIESEHDPATRYALLMRRIAIARENADWTLMGELLQRVLAEFPSSPDYPENGAAYGEALEKQGRTQEARKQYEELLKTAPKGTHGAALLGLARLVRDEGELVAARDQFRAALAASQVDSPVWLEAMDAMGELNTTLIFAQQEAPESKYYTVEPGDTLTSIGIKLNTTQGLLTRANGLADSSTLHPGQRLKYTPKDFRVIVERSKCRLFLFDNQGPFKCYPAGLGMPGYETTLGKYTIGSKQKDPTWFRPNGPAVPPGDPENELGTRWMPMVPAEEGLPTDLGIHGTIAPETIGQYKSHGCPRLLNKSAEELYDLIVRSTPVEVVETIDWDALGPFGS